MSIGSKQVGLLPVWQMVVILCAALGAYAGSLPNGDTYDDGMVIFGPAPFLLRGSPQQLFTRNYFRLSHEGTWRPVVTASYMVDARLWRMRFVGFHATNVFWHALTSIAVAMLAVRLLPEGKRRWAVAAGLLFAVHPATTEAVENVSFREDLLATFFVLAALLLAWRARIVDLALAGAAYALALLSKENAVAFPLLLLGCRLVVPVSNDKRTQRIGIARELAWFGALTIAYLALRFGPMSGPPNYAAFAGGSRAATLWTMPRVLVEYLRLVVIPWPLIADYSGYFAFGMPSGSRLAALLVIPAVAIALWAARRPKGGDGVIAFGITWFLVALGPVSNVIATPIFAAERFLYLPLAGIAIAASAAAARIDERVASSKRTVAAIAGLAVLAVFLVVTNVRHRAWRNNLALWRDVAAHNPRSYRAHANIAIDIQRDHPRAAIAELELSLRLCPYVPGREDVDNILCSSNATQLGHLRRRIGDLDGAQEAYMLAMRIRPSNPDPFYAMDDVARERKLRILERGE